MNQSDNKVDESPVTNQSLTADSTAPQAEKSINLLLTKHQQGLIKAWQSSHSEPCPLQPLNNGTALWVNRAERRKRQAQKRRAK